MKLNCLTPVSDNRPIYTHNYNHDRLNEVSTVMVIKLHPEQQIHDYFVCMSTKHAVFIK